MTSTDPSATGRPHRALWAAVALVLLQALALGVLAVVGLARGDARDPAVAGWVAGLAFLTAAGLLLAARGLYRRSRWARAPILVVNLLVLPVAWSLVSDGRPVLAALLAGWAVAVIALLVRPMVREELAE